MSVAALWAPCKAEFERLLELIGKLGDRAGIGEIGELAPHGVEIADDDGEQVVEVVRDAAGQLTYRLHLHRLPHGRFRLVAQPRFLLEFARALDETLDGVPRRDGENGRQGRRQQKREPDQPGEPVARQARALLALRELLALGVQDRRELVADALHQLQAGVGIDDGEHFLPTARPRKGDGLDHLFEFPRDQGPEILCARGLQRVADRQLIQRVELLRDVGLGLLEGLEIRGIGREQKSALAGLRADNADQHVADGALHLEGLHDLVVGLLRTREQKRHCECRGEHQSEADRYDVPGIADQPVGFEQSDRHEPFPGKTKQNRIVAPRVQRR